MGTTADRTIDSNRLKTEYRINAHNNLPLEPVEYCKRWIDMPPDERGSLIALDSSQRDRYALAFG